jgi:hypothetical protein
VVALIASPPRDPGKGPQPLSIAMSVQHSTDFAIFMSAPPGSA